jgi:hypothetical protein
MSHLKRASRAETFFTQLKEQQVMDIKTLSTKQLISVYNTLTGKQIKKFSDRATGEKQVAAQLKLSSSTLAEEALAAAATAAKSSTKIEATKAVTEVNNGSSATKMKKPAALSLAGQVKAVKKANKIKQHVTPEAADRSAAIALSWSDKEVAAARSLKQRVVVAGKGEFRSVKEAFESLGLPLNKHIKFRAELKAEGSKTFDGRKFSIV